ncbi:AAA domain-containing protein [Nonomuraea sp. 3N208]|uniref:AAA domain-containing protein n=1 Tax=Nonomuraea sp. 3N208 TaxID=3457421 RepID=UPI003FD5B4B0
MAEPSDNRRAELIAAAQANWISALTDLGGRNTLLYYKDRRAGTLDLTTADPANLERFLRTGSIRLTRLFSDADARADAIRRVQAIHRKSRELLEERGLRAAYLATGMARWDELFLEPAAPVLLRGLTITPTRARHDDFHLALDDEDEVNPVLLHKLATVYGAAAERATGDHDQLRAIAAAAEVPGFDIQDRRVIGTFTYSKLPMVRDMQAAGELLADSDVVAAIAGDPEAQELLSGDRGEPLELDSPEDDYSVLDADSSQRSAIAAVQSGRSLVIHGPPGTGKSQTIANLIAALVAKGRKVLFVAEKRAAIDAVLSRLKGADLGDLVLDIHEGTRDRLRIARDLGDTLDLAQAVTEVPEQELDRRLIDRQRRLSRHVAGLHEPHAPWGVSAFQIQSALLGIPAEARTPVRLFPPERIDREAADRIRDELRDFAHLGGFTLRPGSTPWYGASLRTAEQARQAADLASRLHSHLLPLLAYRVDQACAEAGLRAPDGHRERVAVLQLFAGVAQTMRRLSPRVFESDPSRLAAAVGDGTVPRLPTPFTTGPTRPRAPGNGARSETADANGGPIGLRERHALRKQARALWLGAGKPERAELHAALAEAAAQLAEWDAFRLPPPAPGAWRAGPDGTAPPGSAGRGGDGAAAGDGAGGGAFSPGGDGTTGDGGRDGGRGRPPWPPSDLGGLLRLQAECEAQLASLRAYVRVPDEPGEVLAALCADRDTAWKLPRLYDLGMRFDALGLGQLLDGLARKQATADLAAAAFDHAWYSSILDHVRVSDPRYAAERGDALDEIAGDFRERDIRHMAANRARVRRAWAVRLRDAEDRHPLQARVIRKQAALRRGQLPLRRLLDQTGDVLFALKPCWAMSPLIVSQVLPATRLFDVVIFDEASQIVPADAVPSIMRAHQIVVAGDDRQLPPTNFFRQVGDGPEDADFGAEEEESRVSFGAGFESVLDALRPLLPTWPLTWHYRSRDERLVAFSNARIYGGALTTFPGVSRGDCLRHVVVAQPVGPGQEASVPAEVDKVVELVLDHARARPGESLGVIALGMRHAERVDQALREALAEHPELEDFFAEDAPEPFFVKNLERVQGDERDAIILTIGYGKHRDGRMRYQWGPLLRDGGERRLNVAATRAKHRLTLVSSFSSHDVDPARVTKAGARLLADYLEYAGSGGTPADASGGTALNPFEADVRDRLARHGITVVPQFGVGGFRVDFAATHPRDPDRMVLAIEADGASYRDSRSVRDRDRLRKEHLERLGWNFHRLWSTNWFHNPQAEADKLRQAYEEAVAAYEPEPERAPDPATRPPAAELDRRSQPPGAELDRPG